MRQHDAAIANVTFTPAASDHDLIYGYAYAGLLMGHGAEPWLVRSLSAWMTLAEQELQSRGLLQMAEWRKDVLRVEHGAHPVYSRNVRVCTQPDLL
jgi:hypothetical protein